MKNQNITNLVRRAKLKLFTNNLIFFGMCVNKFKWVIEKLPQEIEGYVLFNEKDLSKLESGAIYLNKYYLSQPNYTHDHLVYLLCHELLHILNKHGIRKGDREYEIWCIACDHVIEQFLKSLSNIIKPYQNRYNIVEELSSEIPQCTTEQAYEWLIKKRDRMQIKTKSTGENTPDMIQVYDQSNNLLLNVSSNMGGIEKNSSELNSATTHQIEQLVAEARAILENLKQKGTLPGNLVSYLDDILKVEIPWERLVEKAIKTNTILKPDDRSWKNLNKFYISHKLTLPGYSFIEEQEGTGILIIGVDSSGSISDKNLKQFSDVIQMSMCYFKEVHLLVHDVNITQQKIFNKENIASFYEFIKKEGYRGRGGTSHKYLFEHIEQEYWEKNKDELSMVISLTDNYSDIQYEYKKYNWIKNNLPLVLIVTKNGTILSLEEGYGDIVQIKINN